MKKYGLLAAVLLTMCSLASVQPASADDGSLSYLFNSSTNVTTVRAVCSNMVVSDLSIGGRLPVVHTDDGLHSYTPVRALGQLRDIVAQIQTQAAACVLTTIRTLLYDYADTAVSDMPSNVATLALIHHRGTAWGTDGHCINPCNFQWCACEEDIPDPNPAPTPVKIDLPS